MNPLVQLLVLNIKIAKIIFKLTCPVPPLFLKSWFRVESEHLYFLNGFTHDFESVSFLGRYSVFIVGGIVEEVLCLITIFMKMKRRNVSWSLVTGKAVFLLEN